MNGYLKDAIITVIISIPRRRALGKYRAADQEDSGADRSGQQSAIVIRQSWGPRVHISRSACVNGFRAVGLLLRSVCNSALQR